MSGLNSQKIAFIGTGLMGAPMAANLLAAGFDVSVWNRTPQKAKSLADKGAVIAQNPADAVRDADIVIVMLSSGPVCSDILFGDNGVARQIKSPAFLVVMSSIGLTEAKDMAAKSAELGLRWVDAPVSGGTPAATDGTLSIMAGGELDDVRAVNPVLAAMGRVVHIGPPGTGTLTKLVNQLLVASTIAAVSEGLLMAEAGGANTAKVREALLGGFANSRILDLHGAKMIAGLFEPGGPAKYQVKDTGAALDTARELDLELPVLGLVDQLFASLVSHGGGDLDHSALILELKRLNARLPEGSPLKP